VLVGRGDQIATVAAALAQDAPAVVFGEAGVGKTTLLRAVAAASGRRIFEGGALSTLQWLEYLALDRAVGRRVAADDPSSAAADVEATVGAGALLLDDLQWAAPGTVEAVRLLAGRVGLLVGVRRGDPGADAVLDRLTDAGFLAVELRGLAEQDARALLDRLAPGVGQAGAARLIARTGGNPLLLRELAATGEPSPSLRLALAARLRRLDEAGREAFGVLALTGRPVSVDGLGAAGAKSLLDADLAVRGADDRIEIRHTLLGEVAIEAMDPDERRRLHAIIARNVDDDGEAARHHALAGERRAAHDAALRAAEATKLPGERASHLAVAAANADGPHADDLRVAAAWALEEAHDWPALSALLEQLNNAEPLVRANANLIRARAAWRAGDPEGLRTAIDEGLVLASGTGTDVEVRLRIERSRVPIFLDHDAEAGVRAATEALALAREAGVDVPRAQYLYGTALYFANDPAAPAALADALDSAERAGDIGTAMLSANNLIVYHESLGDPAYAREVAERYTARAADLGLGVWERSFQLAASNLDFHAGNYPAVFEVADRVLHLPLEARSREALLEQLCLALIDVGRMDEAERRIAGEPGRADDWTWQRQVAWVRAEAALWGGRPQRALELAEQILTGPESDLNIIFARVTRAWALVDLGRDPGPRYTADDLPGMLAAVPHEVDGVCLLHEKEPEKAVAAFDRATEVWAGYHRRGELRCRWAAGEAARLAGLQDAVGRLVQAEEQAAALGMLPLLGRIQRSLRAAGVRRSAPRRREPASLLTGRERQVLELVGAGLTNAEIARRLGVSRHTVVSQIGSASAKLGASSRTHAAHLADQVRSG
jgi:DNA-binding CsgD family transcriptional regulator/tetratricopeptide (TPR) repeat protein